MVIIDIEGFPDADYEKDTFAALGADYKQINCNYNEDKIIAEASEAQVILFSATKITPRLIDGLPALKLLVRYGAGFDNVDLDYTRKKGIFVCNAPEYSAYDVAEHAFTLIMSVNRKIAAYDRKIRLGRFGEGSDYLTYRLEGKTLGLVGFGRIARNVLRFASSFNMNVIVYDPFVNESHVKNLGAKKAGFEQLVAKSDFISLHAPLTDSTRNMFSQSAFLKMKNTAVLINTSRGGLVNQDDLVYALKNKIIRGAGIDVYTDYPRQAEHPLALLNNTVLTPHIAWDSAEGSHLLHKEVTDEVVRFLKNEKLQNIVNR